MIKNNKKSYKKITKKDINNIYVHKSFLLPSDNNELKIFIEKNKTILTEHTLESISYAIEHKLNYIELFQFKNSKFVITITKNDFKINLDNIYQYYIQTEQYEHCDRLIKLQKLLNCDSAH